MEKEDLKKITPVDIVITIIFCSLIIILIIFYFNQNKSAKPLLLIETPDEKYYYYLKEEKTIEIEGELGTTTIQLDVNAFSYLDSPCPHKLCIRMGRVKRANVPVICLPNKVSSYILSGEDEGGFDSISQ